MNLVSLLRHRATEQPDRLTIRFLIDGEQPGPSLTHADLDARTRAIGAWLTSIAAPGERALLLYQGSAVVHAVGTDLYFPIGDARHEATTTKHLAADKRR